MDPLARETCPLVTVALIDSGLQALLRLCLPFRLKVRASPSGRMRFQHYRKFRGSHPTLASHVPHVTHVRFISGPRTWACGVALILTPRLRGAWAQGRAFGKHHFKATFFLPWPTGLSHGRGHALRGQGEPASRPPRASSRLRTVWLQLRAV